MNNWHVYLIETAKGRLYCGISTDVARRFGEHQAMHEGRSKKGAKFFKSDRPLRVVYQEVCANRSEASVRESQIKGFSRAQKEALVKAG